MIICTYIYIHTQVHNGSTKFRWRTKKKNLKKNNESGGHVQCYYNICIYSMYFIVTNEKNQSYRIAQHKMASRLLYYSE